jgi:hypothetical protein
VRATGPAPRECAGNVGRYAQQARSIRCCAISDTPGSGGTTNRTHDCKLEALFRQPSDNPAEGLALVASLLSLSKIDTSLAQDVLPQRVAMVLSPEQREARALNILIDLLLGLAARSPVLFLLEDAHWVDPATQELITQALARIAEARVLILVTHRPVSTRLGAPSARHRAHAQPPQPEAERRNCTSRRGDDATRRDCCAYSATCGWHAALH